MEIGKNEMESRKPLVKDALALGSEQKREMIYRLLHSDDPKEQQEGKELLVKELEGYIHKIINTQFSFVSRDMKEDLFQVGVIGVLANADKYNPDISTLTTYFKKHIVFDISHYIGEQSGTGLTKHYATLVGRISKVINDFRLSGTEPTDADIARAAGISVEKVSELKVYLDSAQVSIQDDSFLDSLIESGKSAEDTFMENDQKEKISEALNELDDTESVMVRMRFGFDTDREYKYKEIADRFGCTTDKVRYIINSALRKISKSNHMRQLFPERITRTTKKMSVVSGKQSDTLYDIGEMMDDDDDGWEDWNM